MQTTANAQATFDRVVRSPASPSAARRERPRRLLVSGDKVTSRARGRRGSGATAGGWSKMSDEPLAREREAREREPIERMRARLEALIMANAAPRCGARSKRTGKPCRAAAMPNGRCKGSRRQEYWAADAGGPRAEQAGKVEARLLLSRSEGGTVARAGGNSCAPVSAPVAAGVVASLNRPGGNATGVTVVASELGPKKLELVSQRFDTQLRRGHDLVWNLSQHQTFFPRMSSAVAPAHRAPRPGR
jgi:hypothetical protein